MFLNISSELVYIGGHLLKLDLKDHMDNGNGYPGYGEMTERWGLWQIGVCLNTSTKLQPVVFIGKRLPTIAGLWVFGFLCKSTNFQVL